MTLTFEDANSKLLDVVIVADVDAEANVDNSLVEILMLNIVRDSVEAASKSLPNCIPDIFQLWAPPHCLGLLKGHQKVLKFVRK